MIEGTPAPASPVGALQRTRQGDPGGPGPRVGSKGRRCKQESHRRAPRGDALGGIGALQKSFSERGNQQATQVVCSA